MAPKPPTGRLAAGPASNGNGGPGGRGIAPWSTFRDEDEENPDLVWPLCLDTYAAMDQNGQVAALLRLIDWAVRNYRFELHPGDLPPALADKLARDTHHQIAGQDVSDEHAAQTARVHRRRILRQILRALSQLHTVFELVGDYDDDGTWRLIDLGHIDPKDIARWHFGPDERVLQLDLWGWPPPELPAGRLAVFRWEPTKRHPYGQSMLRPLYEPWLAKDRLIRIDLLANERHGMGVPTVEMSDEAQAAHQDDYLDIVSGVAAGEETGVVMPPGASFEIKGLTGSLPRTLESIRYCDEAMSRTMQGQVSQLGQTANGTGSYALSTTLIDLLDEARDMVAGWIAEAYTEQIVGRWCEYNGQALDRMPAIRAVRPEPAPVPLEPGDYVALADAGLINAAQRDIRESIARRFGLPLPDETPLPVVEGTGRALNAAPGQRLAAAPEADPDPGVGHRQLNAVERRARIAFAALDAEWVTAVDELSAIYQRIRAALIESAAAFVRDSDLLERVDELAPALREHLAASVPGDDVDAAAALLAATAADGAAQVAGEFSRQGAEDVDPGDPDYDTRAAAEAALVADQLAATTADQAVSVVTRTNGPDDTAARVADEVADALDGLTTAYTDDLARGGVSRANHQGRTATMRRHETDIVGIYASELLDSNTCTPCSRVDGTEYADLTEAMSDYPTGGYRACDGGDRCRGTLVAIHAAEQEVSVR